MSTEAPTWLPDWNGAAYAANTGHHRALDGWFLRHFPVTSNDRVLDLGCGSGDFTRIVADLVPEGHVVGLDAQSSMIDEAAAAAGPNQSFLVAPVQTLSAALAAPIHDETFDAVFSRAVLQWVPIADTAEVYVEAFRLLRPGGWLRVECGGAGNVPAVVRVLDELSARYDGPRSPWNFADAGTTFELLERAGFEPGKDGYVETVAQRRPFTRESFAGWLHSQGLQAYTTRMAAERRSAFIAASGDALDEFRRHDGSFDQTFVRLDLLVRKPGPAPTR